MKCPECQNEMILGESWNSLLNMGKWNKYFCEYCSGTFEIKHAVKTGRKG